MPRTRPFAQVDVFAAEPYSGNPVAVVLDGTGLSDEQMQRFAAWTNLSETTFVLPPTSPDADYALRIFTPGAELPFAGHPTLGSAHALLEHGRQTERGGQPARPDVLVQECAVGLVELRRTDGRWSFRAPELRATGPLEEDLLQRIASALRVERDQLLDGQRVDNGPGWVAVRLASARDVLDLEPDASQLEALMLGVVGDHPPGSPALYEVRAFAGRIGVREDPVTGSLQAGLAQWLIGSGQAPDSYTATQGARVGRRGEVALAARDGAVWVGGDCSTCVQGTVLL